MAQKQQGVGARARTTTTAMRGKGIRILRSPAIAHMRELTNKGAGTPYSYRIKRR